jgi:uncharacterized protein
MLAGPGVAGLALTASVHGRAGLREFRARLLRWRVGVAWYAAALLTAVFTISWGGILVVVAPTGIPGTPSDVERLFPLVLAALFAGPEFSHTPAPAAVAPVP